RDWSVTGVQTCALPISSTSSASITFRIMSFPAQGPLSGLRLVTGRILTSQATPVKAGFWRSYPPFHTHGEELLHLGGLENAGRRSEERRVGQEERCRDQ